MYSHDTAGYPRHQLQQGQPAVEEPVLVDCNKRIGKRLREAHEIATRLENVIGRLLNPTPSPVPGGLDAAKSPEPQTLEAMLNETDHYAESLVRRLNDVANRIERGV